MIEGIPREQLAEPACLSKFTSAVAVGLFDAALNYLWDETVESVRARATEYDLNYFNDQAAQRIDT